MEQEKNKIKQIYNQYFEIVDEFFGSIKHHLPAHERGHIDLGIIISRYPLISDLIIDAIDDIDSEIGNFWSENAQSVFEYIKRLKTLKCIYSGDISPVILENFVKKSSLYVDTIILPDPIYNLSLFQKQIILDNKYYLNKLIRHAFNLWKLKDLILSSSEPNIINIAN